MRFNKEAKKKQWFILLLILGLLAAAAFSGCAPGPEPEGNGAEAPVDEAEEVDERDEAPAAYTGDPLQIYAAYGGLQEIMDAFTEDTGIPVEFISMSSGEVLSRMRAERGRPLGDVWFGGGVDSFMVAAEEGLLEAYISPEAEHIEARFKDPDGYWTGVSIVLVTFVVNKDLAEELGIPIPQTWEDLLDPDLQGEILMPNPGISGTAFTAMASIIQRLGEEDGWEYLAQLDENIPYYAERGSEPPNKASLGEVMVGISPDGVNAQREGYPVEVVYPTDGTAWWHSPVAIIAGTPNLEAAQRFVDWTLTEKGQEILAYNSPRPATRLGTPIPGDVPALETLNLVEYDFEKAAAERDAIVDRWQENFAK